MTISFVGSASAEATSVTLPAHQAGDLILMFAWNGGSLTVPTVPSGWNMIRAVSRSGGANRAGVVAFRHAATSGESSGTWTNAALLGCAIYRDDLEHIAIGGESLTQDINSAAFSYASLGAFSTVGTPAKMRSAGGWLIAFGGANSNTQSLETPPTGFTNRVNRAGATTNEISIHDTNADVASFAGANVTLAATTVGSSLVIEVFATGIAKTAAGGFRPVNIRGGADQ